MINDYIEKAKTSKVISFRVNSKLYDDFFQIKSEIESFTYPQYFNTRLMIEDCMRKVIVEYFEKLHDSDIDAYWEATYLNNKEK